MGLHSHFPERQVVPQRLIHHALLSHARNIRRRSLDRECFVVAVLGMFVLFNREAFGNSVLVLQARQLSTTMVVHRAVLVVVR